MYDATDRELRCLSCARPRDPAPTPLGKRYGRDVGPRAAIGPGPVPPGYRSCADLARDIGMSPEGLWFRIKTRRVPCRTGKHGALLIAHADVATLRLTVKEWHAKARSG